MICTQRVSQRRVRSWRIRCVMANPVCHGEIRCVHPCSAKKHAYTLTVIASIVDTMLRSYLHTLVLSREPKHRLPDKLDLEPGCSSPLTRLPLPNAIAVKVRRLLNLRLEPDWSFPSFYIVKDSLALLLEVGAAYQMICVCFVHAAERMIPACLHRMLLPGNCLLVAESAGYWRLWIPLICAQGADIADWLNPFCLRESAQQADITAFARLICWLQGAGLFEDAYNELMELEACYVEALARGSVLGPPDMGMQPNMQWACMYVCTHIQLVETHTHTS